MYPDGARQTAAGHHRRFPRPAGPCQCHGCAPSRREGMGTGPSPPTPTPRDHPAAAADNRRLTLFTDVGGRVLGADRTESHRSPQRRPVFVTPGPYPGLPGPWSPGHWDPWGLHLALWTHPGASEPKARHYPSVREQCGCVSPGPAGARPFDSTPLHTFNGRPLPPALPPPLPELRDRGGGHRRAAGHVVEGGVEEEEEGDEKEEGEEPKTGWEHGSDWMGAPPRFLHMPNGHSGWGACFEMGEGGSVRHGGSWRSNRPIPEVGGYSRRFFSTEVPQKHLNHRRWKGPQLPSPPQSQEPSTTSPGPDPTQTRCRDSDPAPGRRGPSAGPGPTIHDQIGQVVTNLEAVLGGLKQVHLEMKEVVDQIDRLTANMDLGEDSLAITPASEPEPNDPTDPVEPRATAAPLPYHKPLSVENHVFLRTNAPSPVHVASVVKTSRVPPLSAPAKEAGRKRQPLTANGHLPHLCPPRDSDPQDPWRRAANPRVTAGNSTDSRAPGSRTQKPPPYPQNGRCGNGPPLIPVKTQTPYPGRRRQNTSMV